MLSVSQTSFLEIANSFLTNPKNLLYYIENSLFFISLLMLEDIPQPISFSIIQSPSLNTFLTTLWFSFWKDYSLSTCILQEAKKYNLNLCIDQQECLVVTIF